MRKLEKLREKMQDIGLEALLVTNEDNRRYLSGFTGTFGALLITETEQFLLTDFRYLEQVALQAPLFNVEQTGSSFLEGLTKLVSTFKIKNIGFEAEHTSYSTYCAYINAFGRSQLVPTEGVVENLRSQKDLSELNFIRQAVALADHAFHYIITQIKPGVEEKELAWKIEQYMRENGAERLAFDIIVASGERGALPHGLASQRKIKNGELITFDFGAVIGGYCSDLTRTVAVGVVSEEHRQVYNLVLKAQKEALRVLAPGCSGNYIDGIARNIIKEQGYGQYFGHGLGHGVGLVVHEQPRLAETSQTILKPQMVVTVEPGIYIPNKFGIRIEDMAVLTDEGCEVLTTAQKELIII